jgi:hypothetical protein
MVSRRSWQELISFSPQSKIRKAVDAQNLAQIYAWSKSFCPNLRILKDEVVKLFTKALSLQEFEHSCLTLDRFDVIHKIFLLELPYI